MKKLIIILLSIIASKPSAQNQKNKSQKIIKNLLQNILPKEPILKDLMIKNNNFSLTYIANIIEEKIFIKSSGRPSIIEKTINHLHPQIKIIFNQPVDIDFLVGQLAASFTQAPSYIKIELTNTYLKEYIIKTQSIKQYDENIPSLIIFYGYNFKIQSSSAFNHIIKENKLFRLIDFSLFQPTRNKIMEISANETEEELILGYNNVLYIKIRPPSSLSTQTLIFELAKKMNDETIFKPIEKNILNDDCLNKPSLDFNFTKRLLPPESPTYKNPIDTIFTKEATILLSMVKQYYDSNRKKFDGFTEIDTYKIYKKLFNAFINDDLKIISLIILKKYHTEELFVDIYEPFERLTWEIADN